MIAFVQTLHPAYKRVNKAGSFNTRCFPDHCPTGHADSSFCGRPLVVRVSDFPQHVHVAFHAEFAPQASAVKDNASQFSAEGFRGEPLANGVVVFNRDLHAWKYSWKSSRHTYETPHVVRVYAFETTTGAVAHAQDSSAFMVTSHKPTGHDTPSSDLLIALTAMGKLVPASRSLPQSIEFEFDAFVDSDAASSLEGDARDFDMADALSLSREDEARFLAHERLRALLERLYGFMLPEYPNWRNAAQMKAAVEGYLAQHETVTLDEIARDVGATVMPQPAVASAPIVLSRAQALALVQCLLEPGESIIEGFALGGRNDPSGLYERSQTFVTDISKHKSGVGWSPVDVDIEAQVSTVLVAALSPTLLFTAFLGRFGHADLIALDVENRPAEARPTMFGSAPGTRSAYVFATNAGFIRVHRGQQPSDPVVIMKHDVQPGQSVVHLQLRSLDTGAVIKDERYFVRRLQKYNPFLFV